MRIGFAGLGRMGLNIVTNLLAKGFEVVAYNRSPGPLAEVTKKGAIAAPTLPELVSNLAAPRIIWLMVSAGEPVDQVITVLQPLLSEGDTIIDGGNSHYKDSIRRNEELKKAGIVFLDCGTSGGLEGAREGACLTIGGSRTAFEKAEPLFEAVSAVGGYTYAGPSGAGHYAKMAHNAIEYAVLQAYGEGIELLEQSPYEFDLGDIARTWKNGSVIRSWLLELAESALRKDPHLERIADKIGGGETGRWAVEESWDREVPLSLVTLALSMRYRTRQSESFSGKLVSAVRNEFGGHATSPKK